MKALKGTSDVLPDAAGLWRYIENAARRIFAVYGYREVRTPLIEETPVFTRTIGDSSEIVTKQMYTFIDRGKRSISLRPEATAGCVRAYLEGAVDKTSGFVKWFYLGPMFRSERPQSGRLRQFHQIGAEAIGSYSPFLDAEMISLASRVLKECGIDGFEVRLNTLGCDKDKSKFNGILKKELEGRLGLLCTDCKERYKKNVLRVFDCKNASCIDAVKGLPKISGHICEDCSRDFSIVKEALTLLKVPYKVDEYIVRGLDYYTKTVFEITHPALGAKDVIGAGGRYDNLLGRMGGADAGAVGFALGIERMIMAVGDKPLGERRGVDVYIATMGADAYRRGYTILSSLREKNFTCDIDYNIRSIKAQLRQANKLKARFVIIIGEEEIKNDNVMLKDMSAGSQAEVSVDGIIGKISEILTADTR